MPSPACSTAIPPPAFAIMLAPGANALKTVDAVKAKAEALRAQLPPGMKMIYPGGQHRLHPAFDP